MAGPRRAHVEHAPFGYVDMVDIIGKRQAIFDIGRLEGGVALDERNTADEGLRCHEAAILAEHVEAAGARTCRWIIAAPAACAAAAVAESSAGAIGTAEIGRAHV